MPPQQVETLNGDPLILHEEGFWTQKSPAWEPTESGFHIVAPNYKVVRQVLKGLKKRYPEKPWDKAKYTEGKEMQPFDGMWGLEMGIGGSQAEKSVVKSALALAFCAGVPPGDCEAACAYLRHADGKPCLDYYYLPDIVLNREVGIPIHCVHVRANRTRQNLMAYVEVFGLYRMVVCLSRKYTGPELTKTYTVNPVTGERIQVEINWHEAMEQPLPQPDREILQQYVQEAWIPVIDAAQEEWDRRALDYEIESVYKAALQDAGKKAGDPMTEDAARQISKYIARQLAPLLLSRVLKEHPSAVRGVIQIGSDS